MDARYPIGKFSLESDITGELINKWIEEIESTPHFLKEAVKGLSNTQLDTPYRPGGWTVRQVVHHLSDSHLNSYVRLKLALTENNPVIKPYDEGRWAELPDHNLPVEISLQLIEAVHEKWVYLLRALKPNELEKTFIHPESGEISIAKNIALYAWHGQHHTAHINCLRNQMGW
jgi:hypothetical protein